MKLKFLILILFFMFVPHTLAADIKTMNGYALCDYGQFQSSTSDNAASYRIEANVYTNSEGLFVSNILIYNNKNTFDQGSAPTNMKFLGADTIKKRFQDDDGKWKCPNYLFLASSTGFSMNEVYLTQKSAEEAGAKNITTMSLSKSDVNNDNNSSFSVDDDKVFHEGTTNTTVPSDDSADTPIVDDSLASVDDIKNYYGKDQTSNYSNDSGNCNLIDDDLKNLLNTIFTWISIGGIILVIVMTCISGIKVITGTEDAIKDFAKGLKVRIICLVVLLLAPVIVNFAIQTVNGIGNIAGVNQDDPLCGVGK